MTEGRIENDKDGGNDMEYIQKEDRVEIQMPENIPNIPNDLYGKYSK